MKLQFFGSRSRSLKWFFFRKRKLQLIFLDKWKRKLKTQKTKASIPLYVMFTHRATIQFPLSHLISKSNHIHLYFFFRSVFTRCNHKYHRSANVSLKPFLLWMRMTTTWYSIMFSNNNGKMIRLCDGVVESHFLSVTLSWTIERKEERRQRTDYDERQNIVLFYKSSIQPNEDIISNLVRLLLKCPPREHL